MNLVIRKQFLSLFSIIAIAISGCADIGLLVSPISTGIVYWANGEAHKYYENDTEIIYRAVKHVMDDLEQKIYYDEPHIGIKYKIIAGNNNRFSIRIDKIDKDICRMNIRINYLGDKNFAELIYKKIDEKLNTIEFNDDGKIVKNKTYN